MVLAAGEGDERLSSSEHNKGSPYDLDRTWYCTVTAVNDGKCGGTLESGKPYLSIAPLAVEI